MDCYDDLKFCPIVSGSPLRWSVGVYERRRRVVIAWFELESSALSFLKKARAQRPDLKFDYLQSLF